MQRTEAEARAKGGDFELFGKMNVQTKIGYLDQNKWIDLAKAYHGKEDGRPFQEVLELLGVLIGKGQVLLPLSAAHLIETRKSKDPARRHRLAQTMVRLSRGWWITAADCLVPYQICLQIAKMYGFDLPESKSFLGRGLPFAFGTTESFDDEPGTSQAQSITLQRAMDTPKVLLSFLEGEDDENDHEAIAEFRRREKLFSERAEIGRRITEPYDIKTRRRIYAAVLTIHLKAVIEQHLHSHGKTLDDFLDLLGTRMPTFFEGIPCLNVEIVLSCERDQDRQKPIDPNDMIDVATLSVAVPHCHFIVTERLWASAIRKHRLDEEYGVAVFSDLRELKSFLG